MFVSVRLLSAIFHFTSLMKANDSADPDQMTDTADTLCNIYQFKLD